jgi:hypothetical protein
VVQANTKVAEKDLVSALALQSRYLNMEVVIKNEIFDICSCILVPLSIVMSFSSPINERNPGFPVPTINTRLVVYRIPIHGLVKEK